MFEIKVFVSCHRGRSRTDLNWLKCIVSLARCRWECGRSHHKPGGHQRQCSEIWEGRLLCGCVWHGWHGHGSDNDDCEYGGTVGVPHPRSSKLKCWCCRRHNAIINLFNQCGLSLCQMRPCHLTQECRRWILKVDRFESMLSGLINSPLWDVLLLRESCPAAF